jgi:hypothetical protein
LGLDFRPFEATRPDNVPVMNTVSVESKSMNAESLGD